MNAFRHCPLHSNTVTLHSQVAYDSDMLQLQENTHNVAFCAMTLCEHQCSGKTSCLHVQAWSVNGAEELKLTFCTP